MGILDDLNKITDARTSLIDTFSSGQSVDPNVVRDIDFAALNSGNEFTKGLRRFGYSTLATTQAFTGQMAESFAPEFAARQIGEAQSTLRDMPQTLRPKYETYEQAKQDGLEGLGSYAASSLGEGLPSTALMLAGGLAGRGVAGLTSGAALRGLAEKEAAAALAKRQAVGQAIGGLGSMTPMEGGEDVLKIHEDPLAMANTTPAERTALALGGGLASSAQENLVPQLMIAPRLLGTAAKIAPGFGNAARNAALLSGEGALGEFGTEFTQELTGQAVHNLANPQKGYDLDQAVEAGIKGAITGGVLGGAGGVAQGVYSNLPEASTKTGEQKGGDLKLDGVIDRLSQLSKDPVGAGKELGQAALGTLDEMAAQAGEIKPGELIKKYKLEFDKFVVDNIQDPEKKKAYIDMTSNLHGMAAAEIEMLRKAMFDDALAEGVTPGKLAGTALNSLGNKLVEGVSSSWDHLNKVYDGFKEGLQGESEGKQSIDLNEMLSPANREGLRELVSSASRFETPAQTPFRSALEGVSETAADENRSAELAPGFKKLDSILKNADEETRQKLETSLLVGLGMPSYFTNGTDETRSAFLKSFKDETGLDFMTAVNELQKTRNSANKLSKKSDEQLLNIEAQDPEAGMSNWNRIEDSATSIDPSQLAEDKALSENDITLDGTESVANRTYDENGRVLDELKPWTSPFNEDSIKESLINPKFDNDANNDKRLPITISSEDARITPEMIAKAFGREVSKDGTATLNVSPMSLASMSKTEKFREQFADRLPAYDESKGANHMAGENFLSALSTLVEEGVQVNPESLGLPAGEPITLKVNADLKNIKDDLIVRNKKGSGAFRLRDMAKTFNKQTRFEKNGTDVQKALDKKLYKFRSDTQELIKTGDLTTDVLDQAIEYSESVLNNPKVSEEVKEVYRDHADKMESMREYLITSQASFNASVSGDVTNAINPSQALDAEHKAFMQQPLMRENTRSLNDALKSKNGSRSSRSIAKAVKDFNSIVKTLRKVKDLKALDKLADSYKKIASYSKLEKEMIAKEVENARARLTKTSQKPAPATEKKEGPSEREIATQKLTEELESGKHNDKSLKQRTVDSWSGKYLNGAKVQVINVQKGTEFFKLVEQARGKFMDTTRGMYSTINGKHYIFMISGKGKDSVFTLSTLAHEFGHAIQRAVYDQYTEKNQDVKNVLQNAWEADKAKKQLKLMVSAFRVTGKDGEARAAEMEKFLAENEITDDMSEEEKASRTATINKAIGAFEKAADARLKNYLKKNPEYADYLYSFEEWFAEQFSKYVTGRMDRAINAKERGMWEKMVSTLKRFFNQFVKQYEPNMYFEAWVESLVPANKRTAAQKANDAKIEAEETESKPPVPPTPPSGNNGNTGKGSNDANDAARKKFVEIVRSMVGHRIAVKFDQKLSEGVKGSYVTKEEALDTIRNKRIAELNKEKPDMAKVAALEEKEKEIAEDKAILGIIRVAAGAEEQFGLAEHETFHGAFHFFFNNEEHRILATAFSRGIALRQLKNHFKDQPWVLDAIERDPEEAAAYGFQLWMADPSILKIGNETRNLFEKFKAWLRSLFGILTAEQKADIILRNLRSGERAEKESSPIAKVLDKDLPWTERAQKFAQDIGGLIESGHSIVLSSAYQRMVDTENPMLKKIADLGYQPTGTDGNTGGMIQRQMQEEKRQLNRLAGIYGNLTPEELSALQDAGVSDTAPINPKLKEIWEKENAWYKDMLGYQRDANVNIKDAAIKSNYRPLSWDAEKVYKNKDAFMTMLDKYADELETLKKTKLMIWEDIVSYLERGEQFTDVMDSDNEPVAGHTKTRSLAFISREDRRAFMGDDPRDAAIQYAKQAIRQAEYVRSFGRSGVKLNQMKTEAAKKYGATPEQLALANDYIDGLMGNKEIGMSRELKDLYGSVNVYQSYRLLPFSLFSSLVDPLGIAVRSNSVTDAWETFTYSMKNLFKEWKSTYTKDQWEQIAEDWGYIQSIGVMDNVDHLYTGITLRGTTRKMNDALFKYNLLSGWIRNNTIMAVKAAQKFIHRSSEGFFGDEASARYMEELGLSKDDIIYDGKSERILLRAEELEAAGMTKDKALEVETKLRNAIGKFVRQALLNPSSAEMPNWMSNPYMMPIAQLKQFVFAFNATIVDRVIHEYGHGNIKPALVAAGYVPGMIAADFIKDMISNAGDEPPYKKEWGAYDYVRQGVLRSGLTGTGQFFTDAKEDIMRGGTGLEGMAGPTLEQVKKGVKAFGSGDDESVGRWVLKSMPLNAVYDQWWE